MSFQAPITIKTALDRMHRHDYVLPAIHCEFPATQHHHHLD